MGQRVRLTAREERSEIHLNGFEMIASSKGFLNVAAQAVIMTTEGLGVVKAWGTSAVHSVMRSAG